MKKKKKKGFVSQEVSNAKQGIGRKYLVAERRKVFHCKVPVTKLDQ